MDVITNTDLIATFEDSDGVWRRIDIPHGTIVRGIEFENPDPSVGIFDGVACGVVDDRLVDFGGNWWDWWGEPAFFPGDRPSPGFFSKLGDVPYTIERIEASVAEESLANRRFAAWKRSKVAS